MGARLGAVLVWGLVAASVVFWALRLTARPITLPETARLAGETTIARADLTPLLGAAARAQAPAAAAAPPAASRFRLTGVVATSTARRSDASDAPGVALISVDGAPPRAYRVGEALDSNLSLRSVALRSATVGERSSGTVAFRLELPPPSPAATGTLSAGSSAAPSVPAPPTRIAPPQPGMMPPMPSLPAGSAMPGQVQPQGVPMPMPVPMPGPGVTVDDDRARALRQ